MNLNERGEYVLQVSPKQALELRNLVMDFLPALIDQQRWQMVAPDWTKLDHYYFGFASHSLDLAVFNKVREWFGDKIANEVYSSRQLFMQVTHPVFPRRLKWWCKLAYPKINTHQTTFKYYDRLWFCHHYIPTPIKVKEWSLIPGGGIEPGVEAAVERVELKHFRGAGRLTHRPMDIFVGYSEKLDLCLIYNDDPNFKHQVQTLYPLDWRLCFVY